MTRSPVVTRRSARLRGPLLTAVLLLADAIGAGPAHATLAARVKASARVASTVSATCPLQPSSAAPTGQAWAFSDSGLPSSSHPGLSSSYLHGRGTWTAHTANGTICRSDRATGASGSAQRDIVLAVNGTAQLTPGITRLGLLGVGLALAARVSASDDASCAVGTRARVTLFASYHEVHRDSVQLRFTGGCNSYDSTYSGTRLHVLISRNGQQVNSA